MCLVSKFFVKIAELSFEGKKEIDEEKGKNLEFMCLK